jgi:hypothetical protein
MRASGCSAICAPLEATLHPSAELRSPFPAGSFYAEEDERDIGRITWRYAVIAPDNPASGVYVNQHGALEIKLVGGVYHPAEHVNLYEIHTAPSTSESELGYEIHLAEAWS